MQGWHIGIFGGIAGLAAGFAFGWVARAPAAVPAGGARAHIEVVQASGKLDPENARKLVEAHFAAGPGSMCQWNEPRRATDKAWTFDEYVDVDAACADALEKTGLIKRSGCLENGGGHCMKRVVEATGSASLTDRGANGLVFPCGELTFRGLTSITTEDNTVTVKYERDFAPDEALLAKIQACKLNRPETGIKERSRRFKRDDSGKWFEID